MPTTPVSARLDRMLLSCGMAGQAAFALTFLAEDVTRPDFEPWRRWVSHLSLGPWGWVNTAGLAVAGASALAAAAGLRSAPGSRWLPRAVAVYGAGLLLAAICPIDPGLGWPPGARPQHTVTGQLHDLAGGLTFGGLTAAIWLGRRWIRRQPRPDRPWLRWTTVSAVGVPGAFVLCSILVGLDHSGTWPGAPSGLFERIALLCGIAWLVILQRRSLMSGTGGDQVAARSLTGRRRRSGRLRAGGM